MAGAPAFKKIEEQLQRQTLECSSSDLSESLEIALSRYSKEKRFSSDSEGNSGSESPVTPFSFLESARSSCVEEAVEAMGGDVELCADILVHEKGDASSDAHSDDVRSVGDKIHSNKSRLVSSGMNDITDPAPEATSGRDLRPAKGKGSKKGSSVSRISVRGFAELPPVSYLERAHTELAPAGHRRAHQVSPLAEEQDDWRVQLQEAADRDWLASARDFWQHCKAAEQRDGSGTGPCREGIVDAEVAVRHVPVDVASASPSEGPTGHTGGAACAEPPIFRPGHGRSASFSGMPSAGGEGSWQAGKYVDAEEEHGGRSRGSALDSDSGGDDEDGGDLTQPMSAGVTELIKRELEKQPLPGPVASEDIEALYRQDSTREVLSRQNSSGRPGLSTQGQLAGEPREGVFAHHRRHASTGSVGSWCDIQPAGEFFNPGVPPQEGLPWNTTSTAVHTPSSDGTSSTDSPKDSVLPAPARPSANGTPAGPVAPPSGAPTWNGIPTGRQHWVPAVPPFGERAVSEMDIPAWARLPMSIKGIQKPQPRPSKAAVPRRRMVRGRHERPAIPAAEQGPSGGGGKLPGEDGRFVTAVVASLGKGSVEDQREVAAIVRGLIKKQSQNKRSLVQARGIPALVAVLKASSDSDTLEHAVTVLLNVSHSELVEEEVAAVGGFEALVRVLKIGNAAAKANAAAAMFTLGGATDHKLMLCKAGAVLPLLRLLLGGTLRGKKDAALALYQLSLHPSCAAEMAECGGVMALMGTLLEGGDGIEEKVAAVFANLANVPEGRTAMEEQAAIPVLVDIVEEGSARAKEDCVGALFALANNSSVAFDMIQAEGMMPSLQVLVEKGTSKAKAKAKALMGLLRAAGSSSEDSGDFAVGKYNAPTLSPPPAVKRRIVKQRKKMPSCLGW